MSRRADPFDLDAFTTTAAKRPPKEAIRALSEAAQFPSRAATSTEPPRRRRTGRNVQLNIKVTQQTLDRFTSLADSRGWAFGEVLEHAVTALERDLG